MNFVNKLGYEIMDYFKYLREAAQQKAVRQQRINSAKQAAVGELAATRARATAAREATGAREATAAARGTNQVGGDPIELLYQGILGRNSDPEGKKHYQQQLNAGRSIDEIRQDFLNSEEFKKKNPQAQPVTTNRTSDPIEELYQSILGRNSDPEGKKHWQQELNAGKSIDAIRQDFFNSDEFKRKNNR